MPYIRVHVCHRVRKHTRRWFFRQLLYLSISGGIAIFVGWLMVSFSAPLQEARAVTLDTIIAKRVEKRVQQLKAEHGANWKDALVAEYQSKYGEKWKEKAKEDYSRFYGN